MVRTRTAVPHPRRWPLRLALALAALAVCLVFGITTATARGSLGPHEARFDVTTDSTITVDVGPLGTLQLASPAPLGLGVRATVGEIPRGVTDLSQAATLQALGQDLDQYIAFFSGTRATIHQVLLALAEDAARRTAGALLVLAAAGFGLRALLGRRRRGELGQALAPHTHQIVGSGLVAVLVVTVVTASLNPATSATTESVAVSSVFDGTPLEGARITGRLGGIVDTYSGQILAAYRTNEEFYASATSSLTAAWAHWQRSGEPLVGPTATAGATAAPDPAASPQPSSSTTTATTLLPTTEPVTMVLVSDLHCNVGMAPVIRELVELSGAQLVVDAGDTTINGTSVEEQCVRTFADAVPDGVRLVAVAGNHDSSVTEAAYAKAGAIVLAGGVQTIDGIRFFGDADPNQTLFGQSASTRTETETEAGDRIAQDVCDADDVDVLLIHNPRVGRAALDTGCVPAVLSGHLHTRTDPVQVGDGVRYISSSTAGAQAGQPTLGPLHGTAELTVLRWNPSTRAFISWQLVTVSTDATARVADPQVWPTIAATTPQASATPTPEPSGGD
ncbi:MAG: metallophosphoesterase family protein [Actinobacteria bacterium]|nr:metallophosphoesterase family protein [Actinomycetota bacterium]MCG2801124.1 metallophosphoesterase family protein [Cellulomonas sp.]